MSEASIAARKAMKEKAHRLAGGPLPGAVDASGYKVPGLLNAGIQTGMRPITRRRFRRGGHVGEEHEAEGEHEHHRQDRKPRRAAGGKALVDDLVNRNVKEANEMRPGARPDRDAGYRHGGRRSHKQMGGPMPGGPGVPGGSSVPVNRMAFQGTAPGLMARAGGLKRGGHADLREDEELIRREVKSSALRHGHAHGGHTHQEGDRKWIAGAIKHPGALHRALHVPEGEKIPHKKLAKAEHSKSPLMRKRANLAETLGHLHHKGRGGSALDGHLQGTRPTGGREAHAMGGRTMKKGKGTTVNIIIGGQHAHDPARPGAGGPPMPPMPPPGAPPVIGPPPGGPPPPMAGMPPPGPPPGLPGGLPPPMPRLRGGRTMGKNVGSGSGLGRLQKAEDMRRSPYG